MICVQFAAFLDLRADLRIRLATRMQVLVLQTCVDLRQLVSPFGQGFSLVLSAVF